MTETMTQSDHSDLTGLAVVVTGAGAGLGAAYATALAAAGACVVLNDVDRAALWSTVAEIRAAGGTAEAVVGSVTEPATADQLLEAALGWDGWLHGWVNNAGVIVPATPAEQRDADIRRMVEVNVTGAMYGGSRALSRMVAQGSGVIVNIVSGSMTGAAGLAVYGATKGALAALTYGWAADAAATPGIRVNALSPNAHTGMAETYERWRGTTASGQNIGKPAAPNAAALTYLLSDAAAGLTGTILRVDPPELSIVAPPAATGRCVVAGTWTPGRVAGAVQRLRTAVSSTS